MVQFLMHCVLSKVLESRGFFNSTSVETLKQLCSDFILSLQTHLSPTSAADIESQLCRPRKSGIYWVCTLHILLGMISTQIPYYSKLTQGPLCTKGKAVKAAALAGILYKWKREEFIKCIYFSVRICCFESGLVTMMSFWVTQFSFRLQSLQVALVCIYISFNLIGFENLVDQAG